jgi:hypothetical protein
MIRIKERQQREMDLDMPGNPFDDDEDLPYDREESLVFCCCFVVFSFILLFCVLFLWMSIII